MTESGESIVRLILFKKFYCPVVVQMHNLQGVYHP
jgi:hypothetical protein